MRASTKSVIFFIIVYLGSLGILAAGIGYLYYMDQKQSIINKMRFEMRYKIKSINAKLEYYHANKKEDFIFYEEGYGIALYDNKRELIASNFTHDTIKFAELFYSTEKGDISLPQKELKLLKHFLQHPNEVVTFENLYEVLWDYDENGSSESLRAHIKNLRKQLTQDMIHNLRGIGYRFEMKVSN